MSDQNLSDEIFDILFNENTIEQWEVEEPEYDLDNMGGLDVTYKPENAKTIEEVESFEAREEVMGDIIWRAKRKKINERPRKN